MLDENIIRISQFTELFPFGVKYLLFSHGWGEQLLGSLGGRIAPAAAALAASSSTSTDTTATTILGLSPYYAIIAAMAAGSAAKQIFWLLYVSELQRKAFKADRANEGKPFAGGLFAWARCINYGGYTLWRTGYGLAAAGVPFGGLIAVLFGWDFATRAIPVMDAYCSKRVCDHVISVLCFWLGINADGDLTSMVLRTRRSRGRCRGNFCRGSTRGGEAG